MTDLCAVKSSSGISTKTTPEYQSQFIQSPGKTGLQNDPEELSNAAKLWRSVLGQAIRDVYHEDNARKEVIRWLDTDDFEVVCDYAEVDPVQMREQIASLCRLPLPLARKYGKMLRTFVMVGVHSPEPVRSGEAAVTP
jgi:hypothetical protein